MKSRITLPTFPPNWIVDCDVIIVGAGYGGIITGAILSRKGLKTVVVEETDQAGGRLGSVPYEGYWVDFGHRDARDFGDDYMIMTQRQQYGKKAAEAAGAEIAWVGPIEPLVRMHRMADDKVVDWLSTAEGSLNFVTGALDLSADQAAKFLSILEKLGAEDPQKWMAVTLKEWLPTIKDKAFHQAFWRLAQITFALPLEECSVGRWIQLLQNPIQLYKANDPEVGGQQGLIEPYCRVIRKHGGEIKLGQQTVEISMEDNKVTGVVVRDKTNTVQIFRAPVVVFNNPIWEVFKVLDESHFPSHIVEEARKVEIGYWGDILSLNIGLSRLPTIKATGKVEGYVGWHQLLELESGGGDGWYIPTIASEKQAPPGKHLLIDAVATGGEVWPFKYAKFRTDRVHDIMRRYYSDLDEITEWVSYQWQRCWPTSGYWRGAPRAPLQVDGLEGLYFVGCTEVDGLYNDIDANSALQVSQLILERRGK